MMELTEEQIKKINEACPYSYDSDAQGVFVEPSGIPVTIKTHVIYVRWITGGMKGGSYHEDSYLRPYKTGSQRPYFEALELVLKELMPEITNAQRDKIESLIHTANDDNGADYYGNYDEYDVEYIILEDLIKLLKSFKDEQ